jgi:tetratricopeptide (TPR) repeat protein
VNVKKSGVLLLVVLLCGCSTAHRFPSEFEFANRLASSGLWNEALFRWQKSLAQGNDSAAIHNNMAVALECLGRFDEAEKEYLQAQKRAPTNPMIKGNFERFQKNLVKGKDEKK